MNPPNNSMKQETDHDKSEERGFLLDTLIKGFLTVLPLTIILTLVSIVFNFIFEVVSPLSLALSKGSAEPHWSMNLVSTGILILFIFIIGLLMRNKSIKLYFALFENKYLNRIPLYKIGHQTVY